MGLGYGVVPSGQVGEKVSSARAVEGVTGGMATWTAYRDDELGARDTVAIDLLGDGEASSVSGVGYGGSRSLVFGHHNRLRQAASCPAFRNCLCYGIGPCGQVGECVCAAGTVEGMSCDVVAGAAYCDREGHAGQALTNNLFGDGKASSISDVGHSCRRRCVFGYGDRLRQA